MTTVRVSLISVAEQGAGRGCVGVRGCFAAFLKLPLKMQVTSRMVVFACLLVVEGQPRSLAKHLPAI